MDLTPYMKKHLSGIDFGKYTVYPVDAQFGGGWKVVDGYSADCEHFTGKAPSQVEYAHVQTLEEALTFVETELKKDGVV